MRTRTLFSGTLVLAAGMLAGSALLPPAAHADWYRGGPGPYYRPAPGPYYRPGPVYPRYGYGYAYGYRPYYAPYNPPPPFYLGAPPVIAPVPAPPIYVPAPGIYYGR